MLAAHILKDINLTPATPAYSPPNAPTRALSLGSFSVYAQLEGQSNVELYRTDGTVAGTYKVKDVNPGYKPSFPDQFVRVGNIGYFAARAADN